MINQHIQIKADQFQRIGPNEPPPACGYAYNGSEYSELFEDGERVALVEDVHPKGPHVHLTVIDWITPGAVRRLKRAHADVSRQLPRYGISG